MTVTEDMTEDSMDAMPLQLVNFFERLVPGEPDEVLPIIDARMKGLQEHADRALAAILQLKTYRNSMARVHRLPHELLTEIFWLSNDTRSRHMKPASIAISHVCRRWRSVALDSAKLWTAVSFCDKDQATEFLLRSRSHLVQVTITQLSPTFTIRDVMKQLSPHMHRVQRFHSCLQHSGSMHTLLVRLKTGAPHLEELSLHVADPLSYGRSLLALMPYVGRPLFAGDTPSLRSLSLSSVVLPWSTPMYSKLLHLRLYEQCDMLQSIDHVLDALERCPALQTLTVRYNVHGPHRSPIPARLDRVVRLTDLRELDITYMPPVCVSGILAHLALPGNTKIKIRSLIDNQAHGGTYPMLPQNCSSIRSLCDFGIFEIFTLSPRKVIIKGYGRADAPFAEPSLLLELINVVPELAIANVGAVLNLSNVKTFVLGDSRLSLSSPQWTVILGSLVNVRTLRFVDLQPDTLARSLDVLRSPFISTTLEQRVFICPRLESLEIVGGTFSPNLRRRLDYCVHKLSAAGPLQTVDLLGAKSYPEEDIARLKQYGREVFVNE